MKKEIIIDGNNFSDRFGFDLEIKRKFTNNLDWVNYEKSEELNLDTVNDFLRGGFGVTEYEEPIKIIWLNSEKSRKDLGKEETILHLKKILKSCHESAIVSIKLQIAELENNKGETLFTTIIKIISDQKHIELELK